MPIYITPDNSTYPKNIAGLTILYENRAIDMANMAVGLVDGA